MTCKSIGHGKRKFGVILPTVTYVHTAELLPKHNNPNSQCSAAVARNTEQLPELNEQILIGIDFLFELHTNVCIVEVTRGCSAISCTHVFRVHGRYLVYPYSEYVGKNGTPSESYPSESTILETRDKKRPARRR